ncbi:MAG: hypothetical protein ACKO2Z_22975, partial [Sphaerospermopsis kisseleviana]
LNLLLVIPRFWYSDRTSFYLHQTAIALSLSLKIAIPTVSYLFESRQGYANAPEPYPKWRSHPIISKKQCILLSCETLYTLTIFTILHINL